MSVLNNKNCLITGATGGLGQEIAKRLIHDNCNLFLTGQSRIKLQKLKNDLDGIKTSVSKVSYCEGDLRKQNHVKKIITKVRRDFNHIDVLINCAGIFHSKPISKSTIQDFDNILGVNIRAPFLLCKEFSKDMMSKKWGRIVNIGSSSSYSGFKKWINLLFIQTCFAWAFT